MQGFELGRGSPFTWVSLKWFVIYPAWSSVLGVPFNCCHPNNTRRAHLPRDWGCFLFLSPKPLKGCAQKLLAGQVKVLRFLGSDISKCSKNFYYLKGALENASHFPSLSPQRIRNIICTTDAWSTEPYFIQTVTGEAKILISFIHIKR